MPGRAIGIQLNLGYPGTVSRNVDTIITPRVVKKGTAQILFGDPVILNDDNTYSRFNENSKVEQFAGIAVREVKQTIDYYSSTGSYTEGEQCDALNRGSITVKCNNGVPIPGGKVYIRIKENQSIPGSVVGQLEAIEDGDNTILLPSLKWATGKIDSNRVSEVTILTRNI